MFCPKCGTENNNKTGVCEGCGYVYAKPEDKAPERIINIDGVRERISSIDASALKKKGLALALWIVAISVLIISFVAAGNIASGGARIAQIRSVGGQTLEEAYYQNLGIIYAGYAAIVRAIGLFMASVLAYLGIRSLKNKK